MRVHKLIDAINGCDKYQLMSCEKPLGSTFGVNNHLAKTTAFIANEATQYFTFPHVSIDEGFVTSILEAYKHGCIDVPFRNFVFEHTFDDPMHGESTSIYLASNKWIMEFRIVGKTIVHVLPLGICIDQDEGFMFCEDNYVIPSGYLYPVDEALWNTRRTEEGSSVANGFFTCLGILNSAGVEQKRITPDIAINKRRARRGKGPLKQHTVVYVSDHRAVHEVPRNSSHASPRWHMRRGHIRHLQAGETTWVRPCVVGSPSEGIVSHSYKVTKVA